MTRGCDHKFVDSRSCLKCGWTPTESELGRRAREHLADDDGGPPGVVRGGTIRARQLTPEERARMREALAKLHAPWREGDPIDQDALSSARLSALRTEYPDVAELIGCAETTG
jgi:hypothetical protein